MSAVVVIDVEEKTCAGSVLLRVKTCRPAIEDERDGVSVIGHDQDPPLIFIEILHRPPNGGC